MKKEFVQEIIDCFPKDRTLYYYFKDRYVLMLLSYFINDAKSISKIRNDSFGKLLQKPIVKNILENAGNSTLDKNSVDSVWPRQTECYLLSLAKWTIPGKGQGFITKPPGQVPTLYFS